MSVTLLDVNVLVALHDPSHPNYEDAHTWFKSRRKRGWATYPLTVNGCIRVLSNPSYPTVETTPGEVAARLRVLCGAPDHHFWEDDLSLLDAVVPPRAHRQYPHTVRRRRLQQAAISIPAGRHTPTASGSVIPHRSMAVA